MAGYKGYSMSNNAVAAYDNGEMPMSKWTKKAILEELKYGFDLDEERIVEFNKLTSEELKNELLVYASWHHTSMHYNCTNFYKIDPERVEDIDIKAIISERKPKTRRDKSIIEAEKAEKEAKRAAKEAENKRIEEFKRLLKHQKKYKTLKGLMKAKDSEIEKIREVQAERIAIRREELRKNWEKQGNEYGLSRINDDSFIDDYIKPL